MSANNWVTAAGALSIAATLVVSPTARLVVRETFLHPLRRSLNSVDEATGKLVAHVQEPPQPLPARVVEPH
jgi:hypothetical protein